MLTMFVCLEAERYEYTYSNPLKIMKKGKE
jgi:hypothetical protein